eukprot:1151315-Pelagomonas_calceolata.AAC.11
MPCKRRSEGALDTDRLQQALREEIACKGTAWAILDPGTTGFKAACVHCTDCKCAWRKAYGFARLKG